MSLFYQLKQKQNSNSHTIEDFIADLGIDPSLIHFDLNNQEFY